MWLRQLSFFVFGILFCTQIVGQITISGTVMDAELQEPLIGASVYSPGTKEGTVSDLDGNFKFTTHDSIIIVSYTGYKTIEKKIDPSQQNLNIDFALSLYPESFMCICITISTRSYKLHPSITYLQPKDLSINNEVSITPSLNLVPGVFMHSGALNTNRITIRGIGNRNLFGTAKIRAYLDGIPLTNGAGETSIEDIDLSIIDGATVYKGPASSIYGAGLGGMISLQIPDKLDKDGTSFSIKSTGGSYGLGRNAVNFTRANEGVSLLTFNVNQTHSDGYRENNKYDRTSLSSFGKFKLSKNEEVKFLINYTYLNAFIPSSLDSTDFVDFPEDAAFIWKRARGKETSRKTMVGAAYEAHIGKRISQVSSAFIFHRDTYERRTFNILEENSFSKGIRTEWIYDHPKFDGFITDFEFHIGGEYFIEAYDWKTYETNGQGSRDAILSDNYERRSSNNLFSQVKMDMDYNASITVGLNVNYTSYNFSDYFDADGNQTSYNAFPRIWSPFLNFGFDVGRRFSWNEEFSFSATVSHGFSPPTVEESLLSNGRINKDLVPEQGWNYELGIKGNFRYKLFYGASFYSMQIKDLLVAQRTDFDQFIGVNAGKTSHNGIELSLRYNQYIHSFELEPFLNYTYSAYTFKEFIDEDNDYSGNDLTGTAPHLLSVGTNWSANKFYGNVVYRFVDAMPMRDDNSIYSDAYQLVDLKVGLKHNFEKNWNIDFFAGINNLFNEKYASMILINAGSFGNSAPRYYYPGLPRNFYVGLMVGFGE